jgi:hypothetical protein
MMASLQEAETSAAASELSSEGHLCSLTLLVKILTLQLLAWAED